MMAEFFTSDGDEIEAKVALGFPDGGQIIPCRGPHSGGLYGSDGFFRNGCSPQLDLDEDEEIFVESHNVNLAMAGIGVAGDDSEADAPQVRDGPLLALIPKPPTHGVSLLWTARPTVAL